MSAEITPGSAGNVLVVSPHPADESIGAPATLHQLRDNGFRVVNFAVSTGSNKDRGRLKVLSDGDNLTFSERKLGEMLSDILVELDPVTVVGPNVHGNDRGHEAVARVTRDTIELGSQERALWMYNISGDDRHSNLYVPFGDTTLAELDEAISAYREEDRPIYRDILMARVGFSFSHDP